MLNDSPEMSSKARELISSGNAYTKPEVIADVVYVLKKVYQIEKDGIQKFIHSLLDDISCTEEGLHKDGYGHIFIYLFGFHRLPFNCIPQNKWGKRVQL